MTHSYLLRQLLLKASDIQQQRGLAHASVLCFLMATADFCATPYTAFNEGDNHLTPERFEEERLRYLFSLLFARSPQLSFVYYRALSKQALPPYEAPFCPDGCESIAQLRGKDAVSADVALLCALDSMPAEHRAVLQPPYRQTMAVTDILAAVDRGVYNYTIAQIDALCEALQAKAAAARAARDFRPAAAFAEADTLIDRLLKAVTHTVDGNILQLCLPAFFGTEDGTLRLSIGYGDGIYYVHDNGSAIAHLNRRTDADTAQRALSQVCHPMWIQDGRVRGRFSQLWLFAIYLQKLIFIAHADLLCDRVTEPLYPYDSVTVALDERDAEPFDTAAFLSDLTAMLSADYDETAGLSVAVSTHYSIHSTTVSYRIQTLSDGTIRITDRRAGRIEGEIFENAYWNHDDLTPYAALIASFCARFNADFDGKELSLTVPCATFNTAMWRFVNLAVLLSEVGRLIE